METKLEAVRVHEVILNDETNPKRYEILGGNDAVGTILYARIDQELPVNGTTDYLGFAKPLFSGLTQYPVVNEIVYLLRGPSFNYFDNNEVMSYYLPPIRIQNHPLHNAFPIALNNNNIPLTNEDTEAGASNSNDQEYTVDLGEYFNELEEIRPLRPYEGDTILEGRFGNSIRLGATTYNQLKDINRWSNEGEIGNPITIIRNGQREDEVKESFEHVVEDIDNDDSSIYLCSNQQITGFIPASNYQLSFGANLEAVQKVEPEVNNDPLPEDVEEEVTVTPPPIPPEPEDIPPVEETEDVADYDDAPTEEQILFPDEDLGDLPSSYENTEGIDVERQLGPPINTPPPLHADAEESIDIDETMAMFADMRIQADKSPFGFYNSKQGPFNRIALKDKDMKLIYETDRSSGTVAELINETKVALGI